MWSGAAHASSFDELSSQNCDDAPEPLLKQCCVHAVNTRIWRNYRVLWLWTIAESNHGSAP